MSLEISKNTKLKILNKKKINISKEKLLDYVNFIYNKFLDFSENIKIKVNKKDLIDYSKKII